MGDRVLSGSIVGQFFIIVESDSEELYDLVGPFPSHQKANDYMQREIDAAEEYLQAEHIDNKDDSDASHFILEYDGDHRIEWSIVPSVSPDNYEGFAL